MKKPKWKKMKAKCGSDIFALYDPQEGVAINVLVRAGSCDEKRPKQAGFAHAMEHMVFEGSRLFPTTKELTEPIESCGGKTNAGTDIEETFFHCYLPIQFSERGFLFLSEMLLNPVFNPERIETEMQNIVQEIKRSHDDTATFAEEQFAAAIYGNHPFANPVIGAEEVVLSFKKNDFIDWKNKFYYPENFTFIVAGGLEPQKAKFLIDKFFNINPSGRQPNNRIISPALVGPTPRFLFVPRDGQQANIYIGTAVAEGNSSETRALDFFAEMIDGGSQSNPLFQEIRDKRGLSYKLKAGVNYNNLLSSFYVYVGTDPSKRKEVSELVRQIIDKSKNSRELFEKAKTRTLGVNALYFGSMSPEEIIEAAAYDIIMCGSPLVFEDAKKEIESITLEEVEAAVNKYLSPDRMTTVVVGPKVK